MPGLLPEGWLSGSRIVFTKKGRFQAELRLVPHSSKVPHELTGKTWKAREALVEQFEAKEVCPPLEEDPLGHMPPRQQSGSSDLSLEEDLARLVFDHSFHRALVPTGVPSKFQILPEVRVVFFDVYGTLFLGMRTEPFPAIGWEADSALARVIQAAGLRLVGSWEGLSGLLAELIARCQQMLRQTGVDYPEVDIPAIWGTFLQELQREGKLAPVQVSLSLLRRLALHWEVVRNPVWPAPGLPECLRELHQRGYQLGIISNAQFYCRILFETLLGQPLEKLGFSSKLVFFSYEQGWAKPGSRLFELAVASLADMGFAPAQALHVGNDVLQDIMPAQRAGFRTALLAQDRYNLMLGKDDGVSPRPQPDLILSTLSQLLQCLPGCK